MKYIHDTLGIILIVFCCIIVAVLWYKKLMPKHVNLHEVKCISEDTIKLV